MDELWNDYLQYLIWRGGLKRFVEYVRLFKILHNIEFEWVVDRDDNRNEDGSDLRDDYCVPDYFNKDVIEDFYRRGTSVLEMLIALAIRVDNEFIGDPAEEHPENFFMEMLNNLGLLRFRGNRYDRNEVFKIVSDWMDRRFKRNGQGSPFPMKKDKRDQRQLEIWDQMNAYISENYA